MKFNALVWMVAVVLAGGAQAARAVDNPLAVRPEAAQKAARLAAEKAAAPMTAQKAARLAEAQKNGTLTEAQKAARAAAVPDRAAKVAARNSPPLVAQVVRVEGQSLIVMTQPMMGPDGLIASKEKKYDTTNATVIAINGEPKALGDLLPGGQIRIRITDDGKTIEHIEAKIVTPADRAAKKAARETLPVVPPVVPPAETFTPAK